MKLCCGLLGNMLLEAKLSGEGEVAALGETVVVLEGEEVLLPEDAGFGEFSLVEATEEAREGLRQAGYTLPDWEPSRLELVRSLHLTSLGGVPVCPGGHALTASRAPEIPLDPRRPAAA